MTKTFVIRMADHENHLGINGTKRIFSGLFLATAIFLHLNASAQEVNLGTANNFAVLGASAISSAGGSASVINGGNVGLYPDGASSITGPIAITPPYTTYAADPGGVALKAQNDLTKAYNQAFGLARTATLTGEVLGTVGTKLDPLTPGVYFFASSAQLTGTLYLNDEGKTDPVFVFQIGSTLTTASDSAVVELNPGVGTVEGTSVFWQIGSSATLGTGTDFDGNILAYTSITDDGDSTVDGRLLAMGGGGVGGAVTLEDTTINTPPAEVQVQGPGGSVPDTGSTLLLLGSALAALIAFERRFSALA
jgi:hypothetical protein